MSGWWIVAIIVGSLIDLVLVLILTRPRRLRKLADSMAGVRVLESATSQCLICHSSLGDAIFVQVCPRRGCGAAYHRECWAYNRRCARYGCGGAAAA